MASTTPFARYNSSVAELKIMRRTNLSWAFPDWPIQIWSMRRALQTCSSQRTVAISASRRDCTHSFALGPQHLVLLNLICGCHLVHISLCHTSDLLAGAVPRYSTASDYRPQTDCSFFYWLFVYLTEVAPWAVIIALGRFQNDRAKAFHLSTCMHLPPYLVVLEQRHPCSIVWPQENRNMPQYSC